MIKNATFAAAAFAAVALMGVENADAQSCGGSRGVISIGGGGHHGHGGFGISINRGYGNHFGHGYHNVGYGGFHSYRRPVWHDTTHLDYHGPSLQRHGNHYDYVPGHYDVHRSGHWDH